jgi:glucose/arabinose dehydrogenase
MHPPLRSSARLARVLAVMLPLALAAGCAGPVRPTGNASPSAAPGTAPPASAAASQTPPAASSSPVGQAPALRLEPVVDGFREPVDIAWRADDPSSLFVVEQGGRIRIVRDGAILETPFLDIAGIVTAGGEQGLLGLAFWPPGAADQRFFVYYTALDGEQVVASYQTLPDDPDRADPKSERILLRMPDRYANHNGGALAFGPDGYLYISTGDGGGGGDPLDSGRHLDTLLAKVLRIDPDAGPGEDPAYTIPADNPFVETDGARQEIWLTGLRNPWRIRFDRATGDLWIGDVGQNEREEIDVARAGVGGLDFGWNVMEGSSCFRDGGDDCLTDALTLPVTEYGHDEGCSVTGGAVYRGEGQPALRGWYVFADYCTGRFWVVDAARDELAPPTFALDSNRNISAIAEDAAGELFVTDHGGGELLRVVVDGG